MRATIGVAIFSLPLFSYTVGYNNAHDDDACQVDHQVSAHRNTRSTSNTSCAVVRRMNPRFDLMVKSCA